MVRFRVHAGPRGGLHGILHLAHPKWLSPDAADQRNREARHIQSCRDRRLEGEWVQQEQGCDCWCGGMKAAVESSLTDQLAGTWLEMGSCVPWAPWEGREDNCPLHYGTTTRVHLAVRSPGRGLL
jgi:hypothetical protein